MTATAQRLLHQPRSAAGADQDTDSSADLYQRRRRRRRRPLTRVSSGVRRPPATPTPATRSPTPSTNTGTRSPAPATAGSWRDRRRRRRRGRRGASTSSPRSCSTAPATATAERAQPLRRQARLGAALRGDHWTRRLDGARTAGRITQIKRKASAPPPGPAFVAADASGGPSDGDIYVADNKEPERRSERYDAEGNLITG